MHYISTTGKLLACTALLTLGAGSVVHQDAAAAAIEPAVWQHHEGTLDFTGWTTTYTCSGLEGKVQELLRYLGARADLKVKASCPHLIGLNREAFVHLDFYTLTLAPSGASDTVPGHWSEVLVAHERPAFMTDGECELVNELKSLIQQDFSWQHLRYNTSCMPYQSSLADYSIMGDVLQPPNRQARAD